MHDKVEAPDTNPAMNLLTDELITVARSGKSDRRVSLPMLLGMCVRDEIVDWPSLRPHQYPAWHMFLVQLATLAHRSVGTDRIEGEDMWRKALRSLAPEQDKDEPWRLVVDDWQQPAFLQPPCPIGAETEYKNTAPFADSIDMLITAKNHDLKANRIARGTPEQWLYALISLQTTEGFLGAGNYGIARMNGGFASRPMLRCHSANLGPGAQVVRDVQVLLRHWDRWYTEAWVGTDNDLQPLLWLLPWDGQTSLALSAFHPLAIEVCRRVRLVADGDRLLARTVGSKVARVNAKAANGSVGCPWMPINKKGSKAFTLGADGFGYRRMVRLLDPGEYNLPLLAIPESEGEEGSRTLHLVAAGIARGQGKTEGVHQRRILLSPRTVSRLPMGGNDETSTFVQRAKLFQEMAGIASGKILRPALIQRIQGKTEPNWQHPANGPRTSPWTQRFDAEIDQQFFQQLDDSFANESDDDEAAREWSVFLAKTCKQVFEEACRALPSPSEERILAEARAWGRLRASIWKFLPLTRRQTKEANLENT